MTTLANSTNDLKNMLGQFMKMNTTSTLGSRTLPSNTITNPRGDLKGITTRSGVAYKGPTIPTTSFLKIVERETEVTKDTMPPTNNGGTEDVQPPFVQVETQVPNSEPVEAPVSALKPNSKPSIPYPSRLNDQKLREKANNQMEKFFQILQDLHFNISFADALVLMPKFASTIKGLLSNKEKLFELARTPLNEHCSAVLLKNLPEKLRDPGKFLIPCDFPGMDLYLALADLGASINLMPLSMWKKLSLPELTPTCMTLELADQRSFLKTGRALIDVYAGELTLRVGNNAVTFNLDQTSRYSSNYDNSVNRIDIIDVACEEYSQEVLGFSMSGNPTPSTEPIVSISSPTLTPFGDSDFLLEETDAFLAIEDETISLEIDDSYYDSEGDILFLEEFLNDDPSSPPFPPQELKVVEPKNEKYSIDEPPEVKDLPHHLEYAFLEGTDKLPVIIAKNLKYEEKAALIKAGNLYIIMSNSEHSTVTYTSISFLVEDDSDIGSPGVDGPPIMPEDPYAYIMAAYEVPPSPDYIPGPEEDEILPAEEQPLPAAAALPTADSPGYVPESDPEEEPEEDDEDPEEDPTDYPADGDDDDVEDEDEDKDEEEEEEHPSPADSVPPIHRMTARISIRDEPSISLPPKEEVERLLALTTPLPSPLTPLSSPLPQIPSPPLPIPLPLPNSPTHIEIPKSCLPLRKRVRFASPTPSHEVGESLAAGAARQDRPAIAREDLYGFVDGGWMSLLDVRRLGSLDYGHYGYHGKDLVLV
ncbi:reverse transcriptase domain-containing protein [Tanacetum coccineum]|uniref:Reverse transcriptase domain-containing protein n=1 Tax=Tanacetum coccineum TaxID=301880 RepID=A0ABQ5JEE4_9ASTR